MEADQSRFTIAVIAGPQAKPGELNVNHSVKLVKAALLYGEHVVLCCPVTYMMLQIGLIEDLTPDQRIDFMFDLVPSLDGFPGVSTSEFVEVVRIYKQLRSKQLIGARLSLTESAQLLALRNALQPAIDQWITIADNQLRESGARALKNAIGQGLVEVHDFYVDQTLDSYVDQYFEFLKTVLESGLSYPMLDEQSGGLARAAVNEGKVRVSDARTIGAKQAQLAGQLLERLPLFEHATIDEVVGIRNELEKPLVRFRSAMISFAETVRVASWDPDFPIEVERLFIQEVAPAVLEIEEAISSNRYLKRLIRKAPKEFRPAALVAAISQASGMPEILSAVLPAQTARVLLSTLLEQRETAQDIEENDLYFYYRASRDVAKTVRSRGTLGY